MASRGEIFRREIKGTPLSRHSMGSDFVKLAIRAERVFYSRRGPGNKTKREKHEKLPEQRKPEIIEEIAVTDGGNLLIIQDEQPREYKVELTPNNKVVLVPV